MPGDALAWTRETPWRQGHVLPADAVKELGLVHPDGIDTTCVVVISHDCDLANDDLDDEPHVEVIVGRLPAKLNGNYSWAKSPRTLHFDIEHNGTPVTVELVATLKALVPKESFAAYQPEASWSMTGQSLATMRSWLSVRYDRVAFPDTFVNRFKDLKLRDGLAKLIEPHHKSLSFVYFNIDDGKEYDRLDGSAYGLKIVLVYPPGDDPEASADEIHELASSVSGLFEKRCYNAATETWTGVQLKSCMAISEENLTVGKAKLMNEWRYEHMSLKAVIES